MNNHYIIINSDDDQDVFGPNKKIFKLSDLPTKPTPSKKNKTTEWFDQQVGNRVIRTMRFTNMETQSVQQQKNGASENQFEENNFEMLPEPLVQVPKKQRQKKSKRDLLEELEEKHAQDIKDDEARSEDEWEDVDEKDSFINDEPEEVQNFDGSSNSDDVSSFDSKQGYTRRRLSKKKRYHMKKLLKIERQQFQKRRPKIRRLQKRLNFEEQHGFRRLLTGVKFRLSCERVGMDTLQHEFSLSDMSFEEKVEEEKEPQVQKRVKK